MFQDNLINLIYIIKIFSLTPGVHTECLTSLNVQNEIQHSSMMSFTAQTVNTGLLYVQQEITS